jgi:hypothetical protein
MFPRLCHPRVMQIWSVLGLGLQALDLILQPELAPFDIHDHLVLNGWSGLHRAEFCLQFTVLLLKRWRDVRQST